MINITNKLPNYPEAMKTEQFIGRIQLKGYGASAYQAQVITQNLKPIGKNGRAYSYALSDVIYSIKKYLKSSRIHKKTRQSLEAILQIVLSRLGNIINISFVIETDSQLSKVSKQLFNKMTEIDRYFNEVNANIARIKGKYQS